MQSLLSEHLIACTDRLRRLATEAGEGEAPPTDVAPVREDAKLLKERLDQGGRLKLLFWHVPIVRERRYIVCGNAYAFQGDHWI